MSDPKYLTDESSGASELMRELLQSAREVGLSESEKRAVWAGIALQIPPPSLAPAAELGATQGGAASAVKTGLAASPWLKGLLVVLGIGGASAGFFGWKRGATESGAEKARAVTSASTVAPSANIATAEPAASSDVSPPVDDANAVPSAALPSNASAANASSPDTKSALRDESLAVLEIRRTLRAGDANGALRLLEQARQRFPRGALGQEREALSIEALAKSGARDAAARKADAFLRAHPKSPYAADVQSYTGK